MQAALVEQSVRSSLQRLLEQRELEFHEESSSYASHALHAFAAKFPPQLPRLFITELTKPGETVLDPMAGSGTTLVEACLLGRKAIGVDIDPLAVLISRVKTTPVSASAALQAGKRVLERATACLQHNDAIKAYLEAFDEQTKRFVDYWFAVETQRELAALMLAIRDEVKSELRDFLLVVFSSVIVTKSGGVSLARDLAHSRPHRDRSKVPKNAIEQFKCRLLKAVRVLQDLYQPELVSVDVIPGDCRCLPLATESVDLIVTSPPYANAIDYMRAHKFSLVWMGNPIAKLTAHRGDYIGAEKVATRIERSSFPSLTLQTLTTLSQHDEKKAAILSRYFADMRAALIEMYRVLRSGRAAIVVVGSSTMRGLQIDTARCLAEIGQALGFELAGIGNRRLDRDRRMMPVRSDNNGMTVIEKRIHEEQIIGFVKP